MSIESWLARGILKAMTAAEIELSPVTVGSPRTTGDRQ